MKVAEGVLGLLDRVGGGCLPDPKADEERLRSPARRILSSDDLAGADERRRSLELLKRQHPQRVPHEDCDADVRSASAQLALQPSERKDVGAQTEVGLGLASACWVPEKVADCVGRVRSLGG